MAKQIVRDPKNVNLWVTKDGEVIGKALDYREGGSIIIFNHPKKAGEQIKALHGTTDDDGNFLPFCKGDASSKEQKVACPSDPKYRERAGYYLVDVEL